MPPLPAASTGWRRSRKTFPLGRGIGCFFTGGVGSFRTLQRYLDHIDTLVFVYAIDAHQDNPNLWRQTGDCTLIRKRTGRGKT